MGPSIRAVVRDEAVVRFDSPGLYTMYHETHTNIDSEARAAKKPRTDLRVSIHRKGCDSLIALARRDGSRNYSMWTGRWELSFGSFDIDQPGEYVIAVEPDTGEFPGGTVLAFHQVYDVLWFGGSLFVLYLTVFAAINGPVRRGIRDGLYFPELRRLKYGEPPSEA